MSQTQETSSPADVAEVEAAPGRRIVAGRSIRWDAARAEAAYRDGHWVKTTLGDDLRAAAAATPDRVLIVDGDVEVTCRDLFARSEDLAKVMVSRLPAGGVVSFMMPNWHETATVYMAATLAGMVAHPILPSLRDRDLTFMLEDVDSSMILVPSDIRGFSYVEMMERVVAGLAKPPEVVVARGAAGPFTAFEDLLAERADVTLPTVDPDSVRMIMYTSGTTGSPKGVMHTHNSLHALVRQIGQNWKVEPGDNFFVPSPISHIGGSIYAFEAPLFLGNKAVLMERWEPVAGLAMMAQHGCTHMAGATPFLEGLLGAAKAADEHLHKLKVFICGGASIPPSLIREASAWFDQTIVCRVYGSTEVPVTTVGVISREEIDAAAETDGRPGIAEVRLIDANGQIADEGEVRARGPQMLAGYHRGVGEGSVFDAEGFYRTGDLAKWVDGAVVINGRAKDIIIRNGENIAPKEIEDILTTHPDIVEISIVGVPDPKTGERACAVIVAREGASLGVPELAAYLKAERLAAFKIPERVELWPALPKNDTGKVLKHVIRAQLIAAG